MREIAVMILRFQLIHTLIRDINSYVLIDRNRNPPPPATITKLTYRKNAMQMQPPNPPRINIYLHQLQ